MERVHIQSESCCVEVDQAGSDVVRAFEEVVIRAMGIGSRGWTDCRFFFTLNASARGTSTAWIKAEPVRQTTAGLQ
jgi:hypothetical protein